jgi:two-component system OmpR family response regulator
MQRILILRGFVIRKPATGVYRRAVEPASSPSEPKPRLLIIDDDQELCAMLVEYLGPEGFETSVAATGPLGLEKLSSLPVDLVILDVMLPQLSGFEVLRRIRALSRVPVIMLTARG